MKRRRLLAMIRKEFLHILRDPRSLSASVLIPVMLLTLFGYALSLDVERVETLLLDLDRTPESREFLARVGTSRFFRVVGTRDDADGLERGILEGRTACGAIVPRGFGSALARGEPAKIGAFVDGSDSTRAAIALGALEGLSVTLALERTRARAADAGLPRPSPPVALEQRILFNPELESRNSIVPGLIAVIMTVIAALLTALTVAREWERGTMEGLLATPLTRSELVVGKLVPYIALGYVDVAISVAMALLVFGVPFRGSWAVFALLTSVFLVAAMSLGLLISIVGKTQLVANQLSMLIAFLPAFLLSGFTFAIDNMPSVLQRVAHLFPATYYVTAVKAVFLKGSGLRVLAYETLLLSVYAAALFALANARFRKRLD